MSQTAFERAVEAVGSGAKLGNLIGISRAAVSKWSRTRIPAERVLDVERITGVSRHELRPDIYPLDEA